MSEGNSDPVEPRQLTDGESASPEGAERPKMIKNKSQRRTRVPTSCQVCRKRKLKCDRQKPYCSSCVKNNNTHLCFYEKQLWEMELMHQPLENAEQQSGETDHSLLILKLQSRITELERKLENSEPKSYKPAESPDDESKHIKRAADTFTFVNDDTRRRNTGKKTHNRQELVLSKEFSPMYILNGKVQHATPASLLTVQHNDPYLSEVYKESVKDDTVFADQCVGLGIRETYHVVTNNLLLKAQCKIYEPLDRAKDPEIFELIEKLEKQLPSYDSCFALINFFFRCAYTFIQYYSRNASLEDANALFSKAEDGSVKITVKTRVQLPALTSLLIQLRLAYTTMPSKEVYVPYSACGIGGRLLDLSDCVEYPSLKGIQALLATRCFQLYSPEGQDQRASTSRILAVVVNLAYKFGLHRDPDFFPEMVAAHSYKNLWRKIWHSVILMDCWDAIYYGGPLLVNDSAWDCEPPKSNVIDVRSSSITLQERMNRERDYDLIIYYHAQTDLTILQRKIIELLNSASSTQNTVTIDQLNVAIASLENLLVTRLLPFDELTNNFEGDVKCKTFAIRAWGLCFLHIVYFMLSQKAQSEGKPHEQYAHKAFEYGLVSMYLVHTFAAKPEAPFGKHFMNFVIIHLGLNHIRCSHFFQSLLLRKVDIGPWITDLKSHARKYRLLGVAPSKLAEWLEEDYNQYGSQLTLLKKLFEMYKMLKKFSAGYNDVWFSLKHGEKFLRYVFEHQPDLVALLKAYYKIQGEGKTCSIEDLDDPSDEYWMNFNTFNRQDIWNGMNYEMDDPFMNVLDIFMNAEDVPKQPATTEGLGKANGNNANLIIAPSTTNKGTDIFGSIFTGAGVNMNQYLNHNFVNQFNPNPMSYPAPEPVQPVYQQEPVTTFASLDEFLGTYDFNGQPSQQVPQHMPMGNMPHQMQQVMPQMQQMGQHIPQNLQPHMQRPHQMQTGMPRPMQQPMQQPLPQQIPQNGAPQYPWQFGE